MADAAPLTDAMPNEGAAPLGDAMTPPGNILGDAPGDGGTTPAEGGAVGTPAPRAPESYSEFAVPDGLVFDETGAAEFATWARDNDLTQEQAQKVLEFGGAKLKERLEAPYRTWHDLQASWQGEVKADPEIGGSRFEESIRAAAEVFKPGSPLVKTQEEAVALRTALNATGAGNNPAIVKLFVRLGQAMQEPGGLRGTPAQRDSTRDLLNKMYPSLAEKE